jgi:hypothetical protein
MKFAKILSFDKDGKVKTVCLPGSDGKRYYVILRRDGGLSSELNLDTGLGLIKPPYAHIYVTYHSMAAVALAAQQQNMVVKWCANQDDAQRLSRIEGVPFKLVNYYNPRSIQWGVYV